MLTGVLSHFTGLSFVYDDGGNIASGQRYRLRVAARNKYGSGNYSSVADILAAIVPSSPQPITTVQNGLYSQITWISPTENGAQILSYDIEIKDSQSGEFFAESSTCSGDDPSVTQCNVAYQELRSNKFGL